MQTVSSLLFPLLEMCFPAGLHYPQILPFGKVCMYGEIKTSFLGKVRISVIFWTFLLGRLITSVDPQGKRNLISAFVSSSGNNCGNKCRYTYNFKASFSVN